jgi:hypothetical protein
MKWVSNNIKVISSVWWLIQGVLLLLNEIRVWLEYNIYKPSLLIISIGLIVISFLLFIKNNRIILFLSIVLFLYSVVSLIFLTLVFLVGSPKSHWLGLFLLIPVMNILLSIILFCKPFRLFLSKYFWMTIADQILIVTIWNSLKIYSDIFIMLIGLCKH